MSVDGYVPPPGLVSLTRTAFHEAGHTLVALELGIPFAAVSIEADCTSRGRVELDDGAAVSTFVPAVIRPEYYRRLMNAAIFVLGADVATERLELLRGWPVTRGSHLADAIEILGPLGNVATHALGAEGAARAIVGQRWWAIECVADALVKRRRLTAEQVRAALLR